MKCVFSWLPETALKQFFIEQLSTNYKLIFIDKTDKTTLKKEVRDADVLVGWIIDENILSTTTRLKYLLYPGAGVQHFSETLKTLFKQKQIIFTNSHSNAFATAQHACALLLALSNKIIIHHKYLQDGKWRTGDKEGKSFSLRKKKIGLLGFGAIGQKVYNMLQGFECEFLTYKKRHTLNEIYKDKVELFSYEQDLANGLKNFLKLCDVLICTLPQTSNTINLLNEDNLTHLPDSALLINVGRGSVINEAALYQALKNKQISGAAIDVWYNYKPTADKKGKKYPYNFPFEKLDNFILSPHRGASPMDDPYRFTDLIYNLNEILKPNPELKNIIDFEQGY